MKWTVRELAWFASSVALTVAFGLAVYALLLSETHSDSLSGYLDWSRRQNQEANARLRGRSEALGSVLNELYDAGRVECTVNKNQYAALNIGSPDPNATQPHHITIQDIVAAVDCPSEGTVRMTFCENAKP